MQRKASPPSTPPAIAPAWEDEDDAADEVVERSVGCGFATSGGDDDDSDGEESENIVTDAGEVTDDRGRRGGG